MDIEKYIKKSKSVLPAQKEKKCLNCSKTLIKDNSYLWYQSFCSEKCKEQYSSRY